MNLLDVVPTMKPLPVPSMPSASVQQAQATAERVRAARLLNTSWRNDSLAKIDKEETRQLLSLQAKVLMEQGVVSTSIVAEPLNTWANTPMAKASSAPKVMLRDVRSVADRLGFAVYPTAYAHDKALGTMPVEVRWAHDLMRKLEPDFTVYMLGPVGYYSVAKHVAAPDDLPIYAGTALSQAFTAISMSMPLFRTMTADISALKKGQAHLEAGVSGLAERISALEVEVGRQKQEEALRAAALAAETQARLRSLEERSFRFEDPMLLAVPRTESIRSSNTWAIMGPVWGPEMDADVVAALGLTATGERKKLTAAVLNWSSGRSWS